MIRFLYLILFANFLFGATFVVTKTSDTNDGKCDKDCSLREAIIASNQNRGEDTIILPSGTFELTLGHAKESDAKEGDLDINDDLIIKGKGIDKTFIVSKIKDRVFFIDRYHRGVKAVFENFSIKGGDGEYGGGIQNDGHLILKNIEIKDNRAFNGGGIFSTNNLEAYNCSILSNHALSKGDKTSGFGGGIFVKNRAVFVNCQFKDNYANKDGGGIYSKEDSDVKVQKTLFHSNGADSKGGALFLGGKAFLNDLVLRSNRANDGGAAAFFKNSKISIINARFFENKALGEDLGGGGAIFNYKGKVSIDRSKFESNFALGEGGGAIENSGDLNLTNSIFLKNEAKEHDASLLPSNTSFGLGGAVLMIAGSSNNIENVLFQENKAAINGGAIYEDSNTILNIVDSKFLSNKALQKYGGAIYSDWDMSVKSSLFSNNEAKILGGALALNRGDRGVYNCDFKQNRSYQNGGGIYNSSNSQSLKIYNCNFFLNQADKFGGAIFNQSVLDGYFLDMEKNKASLNGGAVYSQKKKCSLFYSLLKENSAQKGGAIWSEDEILIQKSEVLSNDAKEYAGGVGGSGNGFVADVKESKISYNKAQSGGGFAVFEGGVLKIEDSLLSFNQALDGAKGYGGGILNSKSKVYVENSTFYQNNSYFGGAISNNNSPSFVKLRHTTIANNTANQNSDALLNYKGVFEISNSIVKDSCNNQGSINSLGGNLEYFHNLCGFSSSNDLNGVNDMGLNPLLDNGGRTESVSLKEGALAIGRGVFKECLDEDQRGYERDSCDSGSYERSDVLNPLKVTLFKQLSYDTLRLKRINKGDILNIGIKVQNSNENEAKRVTVEVPMARGLSIEDVITSKGEIKNKNPYANIFIDSLKSGESVNITVVCKVTKKEKGNIKVKVRVFGANAKNTFKDISFDVVDADALEAFVKRFYTNILQRGYDVSGFNFWVGVIKTKEKTPQEAALGFFNSEEFKKRNLSDEEFIEIVYNTFFDRPSDDKGRRYWLNELSNGTSRFAVVRKFTYSKEFKRLVESFGL